MMASFVKLLLEQAERQAQSRAQEKEVQQLMDGDK
jgi:hypothetical protein